MSPPNQDFTSIRRRAIEKRDRAIAHARSEYAATRVAIANLEQDLLGKESSRHKSISSCIESVIPRDRPFTTVDIAISLEAMDNARVWRKRSIDSFAQKPVCTKSRAAAQKVKSRRKS